LASFSAVRQDGTTGVLTTELAKSVFEDKDHNASLYTYNLCIEAEILPLKCTHRRFGTSFPSASVGISFSDNAPLFWLLEYNLATTDPKLEDIPKDQNFDCIVLDDVYGLVVWKRQCKNERFGRIELWGTGVADPRMPESEVIEQSHLRKYFPGSRRAIVLG
jgi:hypothetical protein